MHTPSDNRFSSNEMEHDPNLSQSCNPDMGFGGAEAGPAKPSYESVAVDTPHTSFNGGVDGFVSQGDFSFERFNLPSEYSHNQWSNLAAPGYNPHSLDHLVNGNTADAVLTNAAFEFINGRIGAFGSRGEISSEQPSMPSAHDNEQSTSLFILPLRNDSSAKNDLQGFAQFAAPPRTSYGLVPDPTDPDNNAYSHVPVIDACDNSIPSINNDPKSNGPNTRDRHPCPYDNCDSTFSRKADLGRHINTKHIITGFYYCHVVGCAKGAGKGYSRFDKLQEHMKKKHQYTTSGSGTATMGIGYGEI